MAKTVTVTRFKVGSLAKVVGIAQAVIAFIIGLIATLAAAAGQITDSSRIVESLGITAAYFAVGVVIYPLVAFLIGWVQGAVAAIILNFVFKESGGLELETE